MTATVVQLPEYTPANWDAEVGGRVKTLLIGRATQAQLAALLDLTQSDVSRRLNGRVSWKGRELDVVAKALGVSIAVLYGEDFDITPSTANRPLSDYSEDVARPMVVLSDVREAKRQAVGA